MSKMKGKTNFSMRLQAVRNQFEGLTWLTLNHILRQIYAIALTVTHVRCRFAVYAGSLN